MLNVRRVYIYLVCTISLQATAWAGIYLLRSLLISPLRNDVLGIAFQISVVMVGLPIYLLHWLWAERLARKDEEERRSIVRRLYLYGMMAGFLAAILSQVYGLVALAFGLRGERALVSDLFRTDQAILFHLAALVVLAGLWVYHWAVLQADLPTGPETEELGLIRRIYIYGFSAAGLVLSVLGLGRILYWLFFQIGARSTLFEKMGLVYQSELVRLLVGVFTWLVFWLWAQRIYHKDTNGEEQASLVRKFYLYAVIFSSVLLVVINLTIVLANLLVKIFNTRPDPDWDYRIALAYILCGGLLWFYHALVLKQDTIDAQKAAEPERSIEAGTRIQRIYRYLVAGIGLAAVLAGLTGVISILLLSLEPGNSFESGNQSRQSLAWFLAVLISGLPVWLVSWRKVQTTAVQEGAAGSEERHSLVRKIYLYFFNLLGTLSILGGLIYILYRLISTLLGEPAPKIYELGIAISCGLIGAAILVYHAILLRGDTRLTEAEIKIAPITRRMFILQESWGMEGLPGWLNRSIDVLKRKYPELDIQFVSLTGEAELGGSLSEADFLLLSSQVFTDGKIPPAVKQAVLASPANRLIISVPAERWNWVLMEKMTEVEQERHIQQIIKQVIHNQSIQVRHTLHPVIIVVIIIVSLCVISQVASALIGLFF